MHYLVASSLHQNTKKSATNPVEHQTSDGSTTVSEAFVVEIFKIRSLLRETRKPWKHQHLTLKLAQREQKIEERIENPTGYCKMNCFAQNSISC